jgi:hypothetical protein
LSSLVTPKEESTPEKKEVVQQEKQQAGVETGFGDVQGSSTFQPEIGFETEQQSSPEETTYDPTKQVEGFKGKQTKGWGLKPKHETILENTNPEAHQRLQQVKAAQQATGRRKVVSATPKTPTEGSGE